MSLASKLSEERRARLAAERLLELKQAELFAANRKLGQHAEALKGEVTETRAEISNVRHENQRVKAELGVANQKVEVAERRLWHSIETIQDGFSYFNSNNEMIAANQSYLAVFDGLEVIKPGVNYVTILQMMTDEGIVNTGSLHAADWRRMMLERWMELKPEPIIIRLWNDEYVKFVDQRGPNGDIVSLGLNITETVEYEKQLKRARAEAEAANRAKSSFLANMSHEIRTPMNGVVGMAELLAESELEEEQQLYVNTIRNSGEALLVIINDVLDYSKIEADKLQLHLEPFDLERAIHEVLLLLQTTARGKGLTLIQDYDLFLPTHFVGDPGRIRQILTNLMGNAVKFTKEGHVIVRVTGVPDKENNCARVSISIEDTGIGIAKEKVKDIFGEFNQVESERNRQFEGTGLGLAISQRLVGLMGGEIWVTSEEGVGSCFGFSIELPMVAEEEVRHPAIPSGIRKVLIVDDLEVNRRILEHQLEKLGLGTLTCASGREALEQIDETIDLVMTDHNMPEMDGIELAAAISKAGYTMPVLLLSSNPHFASHDPGRQYITSVLQKPLPRDELFRRLEALQGIVDSKTIERPVETAGWEEDTEVAEPQDHIAENPEITPDLVEPEQASQADATPTAPEVAPEAVEPEEIVPNEAEIVMPAFRSTRRPEAAHASVGAPATETSEAKTSTENLMESAGPEALSPEPDTTEPSPEQDALEPIEAALSPQLVAPEPALTSQPDSTLPQADQFTETPETQRVMRILTAEDNKTNQLVFRKMVKDLSIDLKFANNGAEAVEAFGSFAPDLIFMDISMPIKDGKAATQDIRAIEAQKGGHVPIIALTAHAMEGDDQGILDAGLDHYLTKPMRKPEIHDAISRFAPDTVLSPLPPALDEAS